MSRPNSRRPVREIVALAGPLAIAVAVFGVSFGILARADGLGALAPVAMSATTFAGSAQFAAVSVLGAGGGTLPAVVAAILLNSRYLPIGASVAPSLSGGRLGRLLVGQLIVDESWALANQGGGRFDRRMLIGTGLLLYAGWVGGTAIGVVGSSSLGDPTKLGLDAAFPALFLALVVRQLRSRPAVAAALVGAAVSLVLIPFTPAGIPIIAGSAGCLVGLRWRRPAEVEPDGPEPEVEGLP